MNIDKYLRQGKEGGWKLRLSYSPPRMKADHVDIGLRTRDLKTARIAAIAIVNGLHAINARNKYCLGLIRPMDKESLSCTKRALKTKFLAGTEKQKANKQKPTENNQPLLPQIENHFA